MAMHWNNQHITVIGAGSWGTALATVLAHNFRLVSVWDHDEHHIENLTREGENKLYLPGIQLASNISFHATLAEALDGSQIVLMVVPSHVYRSVFQLVLNNGGDKCQCFVSATKGIENDTLMTMSEVMVEEMSNHFHIAQDKQVAVISGPSFAKEVANEMPTAVTVGCTDLDIAKSLQRLFVTGYFRVYAGRDVRGLELSGAIKNIVAIAAGICDGLGYGLNTRAALITRGLAEMSRLGLALGAESSTFAGLSGLGDLVLTCTGDLSRNRTVGIRLGQGEKLEDIIAEMKMVAEGVKTTKSVFYLAKRMGIEMPILEQVYAILYENKESAVAVRELLKRELKVE